MPTIRPLNALLPSRPADRPGGSGHEAPTEDPVEFHRIAAEWNRAVSDGRPVPADRLDELSEQVGRFGKDRGGVISVQFYECLGGLAILTNVARAAERGGRAIHVETKPGLMRNPDARRLLDDCLSLHTRAVQHLADKPARICVGRLFGVITTLLEELDAVASGKASPGEPLWRSLRERLADAETYYRESAHRAAQQRYFAGTMLAIVPVVLGLWGLVALVESALPERDGTLLATALIAGAIGSTVSVMTRVTGEELRLDGLEETNSTMLHTFGAARPLIGAVFGAMLFLVVSSGIVPLETPDPPADMFLFATFGFVAGFSERFAQDALSRVESSLPPGNSRPSP